MHSFREGNGRNQRVFIESLAKINGIYLDLINVSKEDMVIASHNSINGGYKLKEMFKDNSHNVSEEERKEYIGFYCSDELKKIIK